MRKIKGKILLLFVMQTASPLSISDNESFFTMHDFIKQKKDLTTEIPFIPASSIVGTLFSKAYKGDNDIFGIYKDNFNIKNSPLFVSDGCFKETYELKIKDCIKIDYEKSVVEEGAKFDLEIIGKDVMWEFKVEYTIYDNNDISEIKKAFKSVIEYIKNDNFRLGFKTNSGLGKQKLVNLYYKYFDNTNFADYLDFNFYTDSNIKEKMNLATLNIDFAKNEDKMILENISFPNGLIIRDYTTSLKTNDDDVDNLDYAYITTNNKPYIPGTSISGVLHNQIYRILTKLKIKNVKEKMKKLYKNSSKNDVLGGRYTIVEDAYFESYKEIIQTRTAIDRFSGGSLDGALYREKVISGGTTSITLIFKENTPLFIKGLYFLALDDLKNGRCQIGGEKAIGYGFVDGANANIIYQDKDNIMKNLVSKIKEWKNND